MNGLEKIELAKLFDMLPDKDKQELFDKFGQGAVEDAISRGRLLGNVLDDNIGDEDKAANDIMDLFVNKADGIKVAHEIFDELKKLSEKQ